MKPFKLALILVAGTAFGLAGRALWQAAYPPNPSQAFLALFEQHCMGRLNAARRGEDPFAGLAKGVKESVAPETVAMSVTQMHDRCEVKDLPDLMSEDERDKAEAAIAELVARTLPELRENEGNLNWNLFRAFTSEAAAGSNTKWGVMLLRVEDDSNNALQATTATLALPRD